MLLCVNCMKLMLVSVVEEQLEADEENGGEAESV